MLARISQYIHCSIYQNLNETLSPEKVASMRLKNQSSGSSSRCPVCKDPRGIIGHISERHCRSCGWDMPSAFSYDNCDFEGGSDDL